MIIISGGIGSGKSVVSRMLRLMDRFVYDCDMEAKVIMAADPEVRGFLLSEFGPDVYLPDGEINKDILRTVIFSDAEKRDALNSLVHREVREDVARTVAERGEDIFVESAIPSTGGLLALASEVWHVDAREEVRIQRICRRSNISEAQARRIIESQQQEEKAVFNAGLPVIRIYNNPCDNIMEQLFAHNAEID